MTFGVRDDDYVFNGDLRPKPHRQPFQCPVADVGGAEVIGGVQHILGAGAGGTVAGADQP